MNAGPEITSANAATDAALPSRQDATSVTRAVRWTVVELRPPSKPGQLARRLSRESHRDGRNADQWRVLLGNSGFEQVEVVRGDLRARLVVLLTARKAVEVSP